MSMSQLLSIPIARPIFEREVGNRMYSPTAYFLAHVGACLVIFILYPAFTGLISYWYFGFANASVNGLLDWIFCLTLPALVGSLWGFSFGTFFSNELIALQWNLVFILIFNLGAGQVTNLGESATIFARFISTISPVRYGTEMLMYRIVKGNPAEKFILTNLGYTTGNENCVLVLVFFAIVLFFGGWYNLVRNNCRE